MKKLVVRTVALALVAVTLILCLASCGDIKSGKYYSGDMETIKTYTMYEFNGNKFKFTTYTVGVKIDAASYEGTYEVNEDEIIFTVVDDEGNEEAMPAVAFEKTEKGVKIGLLEYTLVED